MVAQPASEARALAAAGRTHDALAVLTAAGERGDVDALMQHAVWLLLGTPIPRDLSGARALLRRATTIGHVDAALMEVALTANGSGGAPDWARARSLLEAAGRGDHVAAAQLALLQQMSLAEDGTPDIHPTRELLSKTPRIEHVRALLTPAECAHVASVASDMLEPAQVVDPMTGRRVPNPVRTSDDAAIGPAREDLVIRAINLRLAAVSDTQVNQGEALTVLRYRPGQQYRPHVDTIAGAVNQRVKTVLIYLNEGYGGGETRFAEVGVTITPKGGDAIVFTNVLPDGRPDPASRHAGLPVTSGVKWLATRWIRAEPIDPWTSYS